MPDEVTKTALCQICGQRKSLPEMMPAAMVRDSLTEIIKEDHSEWSGKGYICLGDLNNYRSKYLQRMMEAEKGEVSQVEAEVIRSIKENELLTKNINTEFERRLSLGEQLADRMANFGGSWTFIIIFFAFCLAWMLINALVLLWKPFDPYPYILLNLVLSCMAAFQAPVIMMSQNRQEVKDRLRGENDYRVNLRSELEIRQLNEKMDHFIMHQWQRLLEIQQLQMEIMQNLAPEKEKDDIIPTP